MKSSSAGGEIAFDGAQRSAATNDDIAAQMRQAVFDRLIHGDSNNEIATVIQRSEKSVKAYVTALLKQHGCDSRARLIAKHYRGEL